MMQTLAQTVFQGKSVDLTDTQQYGSLISASLGESGADLAAQCLCSR
jgi:type VI secretion system protein ImpL